MRFLVSLLIVISVGGSYGDDVFGCFMSENKCDPRIVPSQAPETPEDFLKGCQAFAEFGICAADATEACNQDEKEIEIIRHAVGYLSTMCQEENPTFEAISSNFGCFMKMAKKTFNSQCLGTFSQNTMESIIEHIQPLIENERNEVLRCLEQLMERGCKAMKFSHSCGVRLGEAVEDILTNIRMEPDMCTPEILEEIYPFFEGLGSIAREEMATWDKSEKKRK